MTLINDCNERPLLAPQLQVTKTFDICLGQRIAQGTSVQAVGQFFLQSRRRVPRFEAEAKQSAEPANTDHA